MPADLNINASAKPTKVWLDVSWAGTLTSEWAVQSKITVAADLADYVLDGVQHYVFAVASIDAAGNITDLRPKGTLNDQTASDALKSMSSPEIIQMPLPARRGSPVKQRDRQHQRRTGRDVESG